MESTSAHDLDRRLADLVRDERHLAVQFVLELAGFAKRELHRELGYTSLFYYCARQLGLSKSSAFRRSEAARLIARFPIIANGLAEGRLSIRALVELREVLTEENHSAVLSRAEGKSQAEAQLLAVEYRPKPVPRDIVRALPLPSALPGDAGSLGLAGSPSPAVPAPPAGSLGVSGALGPSAPVAPSAPSALSGLLGAAELVPAGTNSHPLLREAVKPLTPGLRRLNVTVTAAFIDELEQVRAALSHQCPDGNFEEVVREAFKLVLERDRKRKAQTDRPRAATDRPHPQSEPDESDRYIPAAVKRTVWKRDRGRCTWPMGDGKVCGTTHRLEFDHDVEVALGGKPTVGNIRLLCQSHNLMKAEQRFGRAFVARFRTSCGKGSARNTS